jgi:hypothetical protein
MPDTIDGNDSGIKTLYIICQLVEPMTFAACMTSGEISCNEFCIILAIKGVVAIANGTMDANVPVDTPTMNLAIGNTNIIKIKNGNERKRFMKIPILLCNFGFGAMPSGAVMFSRIPIGIPINRAKITVNVTMKIVCPVGNNTKSRLESILCIMKMIVFNV